MLSRYKNVHLAAYIYVNRYLFQIITNLYKILITAIGCTFIIKIIVWCDISNNFLFVKIVLIYTLFLWK